MHSKEPWSVANNGGIDQLIEDADGRVVVFTIGHAGFRDADKEASARRIVACVNACAGLDIAGLEAMVANGETVVSRAEVQQQLMAELTAGRTILRDQRDDLLAALTSLVKANEEHDATIAGIVGKPVAWRDAYLDEARAAIAKAKGGAA